MTTEEFEDALMTLETDARNSGMTISQIISAYELRSMALEEDADEATA